MLDYRRTHTCKELSKKEIGETVRLSGWVHRRRDHGGLIFVDLRDRFGITQVVFNPEKNPKTHNEAESLRSEWVITVQGKVVSRGEGMENPKLATGEIEIEVEKISILSKSKTPPFVLSDELADVNEELRLKYRYLDIRQGNISKNLIMRHKAMMTVRNYLDKQGFLEIMTPILGKSTPEGARDYLVPSRVYPGTFYALPQSPQIFKQLLMVAGMDKYFQIAQCMRDEDLRADRQPEFTQIDMEMSFATQEELFATVEDLFKAIFKECIGVDITTPFPRYSYQYCMNHYGTDKPDLRFDMKFERLDDIVKKSNFSIFCSAIDAGCIVKGICVTGGADLSRREIDEYTTFVGNFGIKGLAWMKFQEGALKSNIAKFFPEDVHAEIIAKMQMKEGDILFMIAEKENLTNQALDHLRRRIAKDRKLNDPHKYEFLWVTDFPLFEWNDEEGRINSMHHPFTSPHPEDIPLLDSDPIKVRSSSYDPVLNGYEIGSGSQRIHDNDLQKKMFEVLKLSKEEMNVKFGYFIEALQYGTPPHLGIGLGFDRIMMILTETDNIRDVIAFPKTQNAKDLMTDAPSTVQDEQLKDLQLKVNQ